MDQADFTLNFFRNLRHYLLKIVQAWNLAQGKTIESQMTNWDKKSDFYFDLLLLQKRSKQKKTIEKTFLQTASGVLQKDFLRS